MQNKIEKEDVKLSKIVSLCKRRGFVFPSSEIYGGIRGFYDFGPLGVEMKNNIKNLWWQEIVRKRNNVVGIDGSIITHPKVWTASGHIENFTDPLVDCLKCKKRFRADTLVDLPEQKQNEPDAGLVEKLEELIKDKKCPVCKGALGKVRRFNLLVEANIGVLENSKEKVYLRGEACQSIYLDYENVLNSTRQKIPFGIAQIGKAFRNEITPRYFLYRQREFEQWDIQFFVNPKEMDKWYEYWKTERMNWYQKIVANPDDVRLRQHKPDELAHYAKKAYDIEYKTSFGGWLEWEGIHWRGDWDLSRHAEFSNHDLAYTDPQSGEKFIPWIVEASGGVDRTFLYLLLDAYTEESKNGNNRIVLKLNPNIAPVKIAVFPLLANKPELVKKAKEVYELLKEKYNVVWDDRGNIGKRYLSQDEIGTPWCLTIDFDSLIDNTVTVRDRDSTKQTREKISNLITLFSKTLD
jgi:glycyl-tRNA synthetase